MASQNVVRKLYPDFPLDFLKYLSSETVDSDGVGLSRFRGCWTGSKRLYHKVTMEEVNKLWRSLSNAGDSSTTALTRLTERVEKYAENRVHSGLQMKHWQRALSRAKYERVSQLCSVRRTSVLAKLLELGHNQADFPRWHHEVNRPEALTEEEWERIRPLVESVAESNKVRRLSNQALMRKNRRSRDLRTLWNVVVTVASGTRDNYQTEIGACPDVQEFLDLDTVAALMAADTPSVSAADLDSIRPQALRLAIQGRRQRLVRLHNIHKGLPVDHFNEEEWSPLSDPETIAKLDTIAAELVLAVNGFWDPKRRAVDWYPSQHLIGSKADLAGVSSVEILAPGLTATMLATMDKGADTEARAVIHQHWNQKPELYRCARCDQRVTPYLNFQELIAHFLEKRVWFDQASLAREHVLAILSPPAKPASPPTFFDDHNWDAEGDLWESDTPHGKARITKLQNQLEVAYGNDPEDYDWEVFSTRSRRSMNQVPQIRVRRVCRICPKGFSPKPMYLATLRIHIENIHCKEVNVEQDTAVFDPARDTLPDNPCVFDVPFTEL